MCTIVLLIGYCFLFLRILGAILKTDGNGNAMLQSFLSKLRNWLKILSYRRYGENGRKKNVCLLLILLVHAATRGGIRTFTLKMVNTLIKNSSRDDRPSISTRNQHTTNPLRAGQGQ